ncbi:MAG: hypothetical protein QNJ30_12220 [Kiloniellales bacterium]|nr:hypothetical protein [Kiloniellales bacterium]
MQDSANPGEGRPEALLESGPAGPASGAARPRDDGDRERPAESEPEPPAAEAAVLAAMTAADPEAARALQADWGEDLPAQLDLARRAVRSFASPELLRALEDSGLGDHPALIRVAAEVGRLLDGPAAPAPQPEGAALEALEAEIDRLHGLQFARPQEYRSERTQRALTRLYARRYGGGRP